MAKRADNPSFNGAATFRSRKVHLFVGWRAALRSLQWGRDLSVAEGSARSTGWAPNACFNGAATFRSRKVRDRAYDRPGSHGFNGAATFRSRKGIGGAVGIHKRHVLQWGRDLSVAEGAPCCDTQAHAG